jgi:hypothetical protein
MPLIIHLMGDIQAGIQLAQIQGLISVTPLNLQGVLLTNG